MKTLGLKAACDGLFLVARSDFTLFVANPLTAKFKCLPRICPHATGCDKFVKCLIVHGTVELQVNRDSGDYTVYLFGNWQDTRYLMFCKLICFLIWVSVALNELSVDLCNCNLNMHYTVLLSHGYGFFPGCEFLVFLKMT